MPPTNPSRTPSLTTSQTQSPASHQPTNQPLTYPQTTRYPSPTAPSSPHPHTSTTSSWTLLPQDPSPSYSFPATWPTALHDTNNALTAVSTATATYAQALARSGLGKASMSIGSALAASARKGVGIVREKVVAVAEKQRSENGHGQGSRKGKAKRGNEDAEGVFEDEHGLFVLEARAKEDDGEGEDELDATGVMVEPMRDLYPGRVKNYERERREHEGWRKAGVRGGREDGKRKREEDEVQGQVGEDGLVRLFEFDD